MLLQRLQNGEYDFFFRIHSDLAESILRFLLKNLNSTVKQFMTQDIVKMVNQALAEELVINKSEISASNYLLKLLDPISLDVVHLVVILETNFGFKVDQEQIREIKIFNLPTFLYIQYHAGNQIEG